MLAKEKIYPQKFDKLGVPLNIGDTVISNINYEEYTVNKVIRFTPKMIVIESLNSISNKYNTGGSTVYANTVISLEVHMKYMPELFL